MSLVDKDHMTELRPASAAKQTAETAEYETQKKAIAFGINHASNTGAYSFVYQSQLLSEMKSELEGQGYTVKFIDTNPYQPEKHTLISWK